MARLDKIIIEVETPDFGPDEVDLVRDAAAALKNIDPFTSDRLEYLADKIARMQFTARLAHGEEL